MTLSERIAARAAGEVCAVDHCNEPRADGALFCRVNGHLADQWAGRLTRRDDGTFIGSGPQAREGLAEPAWLARAHRQPHGLSRDMTRSVA